MTRIPLHKSYWGISAERAIVKAMRTGTGVADGPESVRMREKLKRITGAKFAMPATSATHAMEATVACLGAKTGDEVIVPSFTLSSTATAVMIRGAKPVFADIDPITYCLDPIDVAKVITKRTVGIITEHYGGFASENFEKLLKLARAHRLWIIEDAAHCIGSYYKGRHLGTFGNAGAFSFHGTKNVATGEGGAMVTNDRKLADKLEIFRAVGTDRQAFLAGKVPIYRWVGEGSSYLLSDLLAALANVQLDQINYINKKRTRIASFYTKELHKYSDFIQLPGIPKGMTNPNWHIYAIKFKNPTHRKMFVVGMRKKGIEVSTHFVPLHSSPMGKKLGGNKRKLPVTDDVAATLVRLPIYPDLTKSDVRLVVSTARGILRTEER